MPAATGFCAVFPAMTRRLEFGKADVHYLANLCHNCGACLHACQYAPPHEFGINIPKAMAEVRGQTYADYAWPPAMGKLYQKNGLTLSLALVAGLFLFLALAVAAQGGIGQLWNGNLGNNFYNLFRTTCWSASLRRCSCSWCLRCPWACAASGRM
jgi:citrate/tricarballylate utilization protein